MAAQRRPARPSGSCAIYEQRPLDCQRHECEISLKTLGRKCAAGCVDCCMDRNVVLDEPSGAYVVDAGSPGPCSQLQYARKPGWVGLAETARDNPVPDTALAEAPIDRLIKSEELDRLKAQLGRLEPQERRIVTEVFGLDSGKAVPIEEVWLRMGVSKEEGERMYAAAISRLRKGLA
jgi:hypothetical protein